jgi:hypothetical protein
MKVATCNFCRRSFRNTQAVRAHLKACPAYGRLPKAPLPKVGNKPRTASAPDSDPGVRSPWEDVRPAPPRPQPARIVAGTGQTANLSALARWMIQSVKEEVIGSWWSPGHTIPSETKAQALVAIDQGLSRLPVDQLPRTELVTIAEGIRDPIYRPVIQAERRAREEEERRRQQARQRTTLIAAGVTYANQALRQRHDLDSWTRLDLEQKVKRAIEQAIDGSESEVDMRTLVDSLVAQHLEPLDREHRESARPKLIAHGVAYLRLQLAAEDDLDARERLSIERDVKRDLEDGVTGEESTADVEAFVDEVLDDWRGETEQEDEEDDWDEEDEEQDEEGEEDEEEETDEED